MLYQLMNKNTVVATYSEHKDIDDFLYEEVERFDPYLPTGSSTSTTGSTGEPSPSTERRSRSSCASSTLPPAITSSA